MHFLHKDDLVQQYCFNENYAGIEALLVAKDKLQIVERNLIILKGERGVILCRLPASITVVSARGEVMKASPGKFFMVTAETFNPYHLITELSQDQLRLKVYSTRTI